MSDSRSIMSDSVTPWTVACQAPLSMGFSGQEYWTGLPFPSPGVKGRKDQRQNRGAKPGTYGTETEAAEATETGEEGGGKPSG